MKLTLLVIVRNLLKYIGRGYLYIYKCILRENILSVTKISQFCNQGNVTLESLSGYSGYKIFFFQNILERISWGQVSQAQESLGYEIKRFW